MSDSFWNMVMEEGRQLQRWAGVRRNCIARSVWEDP